MTDAQMWALLVGFAAPLLVAVVQRPGWSEGLRALVTAGFSVVAGTGTVWLTGSMDGRSVISSILLVLVTSIAAYKGLWKPTGVAPKIETATSPPPARHQAA